MTQRGPWRIKTADRVYDNRWITVTHHEVLTPRGVDGIYGTVHFKHLAIGVLPLDEHGNTWLVGQYRFSLDAYSWEIPEGGCAPGEEPLEAAKRELREETGLEARIWTPCLEMDLSNSVTDERSISFIARGLSFGEAEPDETEQLAVRKLPFEDVVEMVMRGEIRDSLSVATVLKARIGMG
jgi:8-oxo-dGTP pyrophosphatase MutT (NUDIX family)